MKFVISGENYNKGLQSFLKVYYKEELKKGSLRNCCIVFSLSFAVLISLCFVFTGMKELFIRVIYFAFFIFSLISIGIIISLIRSKNKVIDVKKVEQIYEEKIFVRIYKNNDAIDEKTFDYKDVLKVVETKEYFYLFLNEAVAFPVFKGIYLNREEYVEFIKSKGIKVKEYVKW